MTKNLQRREYEAGRRHFFIIGFFTEMIGTMAGFGSSTIFLPLASYFVDFKAALVLVAIFHLFGNISRITFFRHGLDKRVLLVFGLPSFLFSLLGAILVGDLSQTFLKLLLGVFLVSISAILIVKPRLAFPTSAKSLALSGGISGFIVGLIGTGGALRATFLTGLTRKNTSPPRRSLPLAPTQPGYLLT